MCWEAQHNTPTHSCTNSFYSQSDVWWWSGFSCRQTGHFGHHCPDAKCYGCEKFCHFPRTIPTRFLHQEYHAIMEDFIQAINTPTTGGTDNTPIMVTAIGDMRADHSHTSICTTTEATMLEGTPHTLLPITTVGHAALQPMDVPVMITTGVVTANPTLFISPAGATHTTPWTRAALTPAAPTLQHKIDI